MKLLENEVMNFEIDSAAILMYWCFIFSLIWRKKIIITSKRIIISFSWFGAESYRGALSYFYNEYEYKQHKRYGSSLIKKHKVGRLRYFGEYLKLITGKGPLNPKIIIFTNRSKHIEEVINSFTMLSG